MQLRTFGLFRLCVVAIGCAVVAGASCGALAAGAGAGVGAEAALLRQPAGVGGGGGGGVSGTPASNAAAAMRWGGRVAAVERMSVVSPVVVIVPDGLSFVEAIGQWSLVVRPIGPGGGDGVGGEQDGPRFQRVAGDHDFGRFPVLIDDGSWRAREDIARFVRAYKPEAVVRWGVEGARWPAEADQRRRRISMAASRAWGAATAGELSGAWSRVGYEPTGVVVANDGDAAWPAALAIAAFRGQPIVWAPSTGRVNQAMGVNEALALDELIRAALTEVGIAHRDLGDAVESVTLCLNTSSSVQLPAGDQRGLLAITDVVGRLDGGISFAGPTHERPPAGADRRWAWTGQIFGDEARSAYVAMCGLFLKPDSAWLFDGYEDGPPWNMYDQSPAGTVFRRAGWSVMLDGKGRQGLMDWRRRVSGAVGIDDGEVGGVVHGLDAGFVSVTSSGMQRWFDLRPGRGVSADAPLLHRPTTVHFVHSWSANIPAERNSVAGRWIDRGAYVYVGSVHEPFLSAFVPPAGLAERLMAGMPIGAAGRWDGAAAWKVNVFGDPSWQALGPGSPRRGWVKRDDRGEGNEDVGGEGEGGWGRSDEPMPIALRDGEPADVLVRRYASAKSFELLVSWLGMSGRDETAVRVASALVRDDPEAFDVGVASASIGPAFRVGDVDVLIAARGKLSEGPALAALRDKVWHLLFPRLRMLTEKEAELLGRCIRAECAERDAAEAFEAMQRAVGRADAMEMMAGLAAEEPNAEVRTVMLNAMQQGR